MSGEFVVNAIPWSNPFFIEEITMKTGIGQIGLLRAPMICFWLLCSAVGLVQAEEYEVLGIDNRNYQSMFFEPDFLRIEPGDSVTFVVTHFDHLPRSVFVPDGATHWEAEPGKSITVTFREEGIYIFECFYHAVMGMSGVLLVGHPVNLEEARTFFEHYKDETFAMNGNRLDRLWDPEIGPIAGVLESGAP
ncbi:MAG: plastocyanin/azurin family copper-binding protein [Lysobacterales bacterium]